MTTNNISVFRYTDGGMTQAGATTGRCSGTAGDGIGLLTSLLVDGYNWQELTAANLTQSGNVATVNQASHGFNTYQRLWIIGMDQVGYLNGLTYGDAVYPLSVADTSHFTFTVTGNPTSPATAGGSTTCNGAIGTTTATSITVTANASFPQTFPFVIKIDSEYMLVTAGWGTNTWTVVRGFAASTAATHLTLAAVTQKIMMGVAPAGGFTHWTKDFGTTNRSTFRPAAGNRFYFDADDVTNAQYTRVQGYESVTGYSTVPTGFTGQFGTYLFVRSGAASTAARSWVATATDRWVMLSIDGGGTGSWTSLNTGGFFFGDLIEQTHAGDAYATIIAGNTVVGSDATWANNVATAGCTYPRSYTQIGTSVAGGKYAQDARVGSSTYGSGAITYPHPPDGGLYVSKILATEVSATLTRGTIPGLWCPLHNQPLRPLDTVLGTGAYAGKKFLALGVNYANSTFGQIFFEISNTVPVT